MSSPVKNPDNSAIYDYLNWFGQMIGEGITLSVETAGKVATAVKNLLGDDRIPPGTIKTDLLYSSPRERILANARKLTLANRQAQARNQMPIMSTIIETDEKE